MKNPNAPATPKQTWALFCLTKQDFRNKGLTMEQASALIQQYSASKTAPAKSVKNEFEAIHNEAHEAGMAAVQAKQVVPMVVGTAKSLFGSEMDMTKPTYFVQDGVCGFAWVNIKPANSGFAKWLVANGIASKNSYEGGVSYWISDFNQSMQKKEAYAYAYAGVLEKHGIKAYANSRMD